MSDSVFKGSLEDDEDSKFGSDTGDDSGLREVDGDTNNGIVSEGKGQDNPIELVTDREVDDDSVAENVKDLNDLSELEIERIGENSATVEPAGEAKQSLPLKQIVQPNLEIVSDGVPEQHTSQSIANIGGEKTLSIVSPLTNITHLKTEESNASSAASSARPRWSSVRDKEVLAAKTEIEKASVSVSDQELHAPLFRNVSMFKRSYELMDRTLKVYVYRDGKKPIFHQPILKGLYASEGWFMKLMEGNKHFAVKDPRKAHLFYMPFSSRMLEYALYVRNSHNRTNLRQYLKEYAESIAAKYRYWNRTGGADHFLVACHDWAPYETRHHMEHCIKALCNADVTAGFKLGRDVSLPETYVRSARNPLRDLGGKPPSQRHILAFYAGNLHGYLRPILLKYWKDKDPDMKIFGPMPPGVASKMNYIQHMKSSKYCICPKGYEVNSPRVVESIFYECVPVIISDNFVPPFYEVLNWEAFSVIIAEKDIPNLKDILLSIPEKKYFEMQLAVRKLQRHFLWHAKPEKYDLFHMTLHSIWYNRVYQIKPR
ncbi:exostosin domain-containing protein [Citrus sinensis]|uniref:Exostosin domain-containing protein n=1 Tax=Citrus sinensis TaxID=2711 RepID=A0ACB8NRX3_CITSI|nr:exostosin domain-containing protein [Citrus sinensis]